MVPRLYKASGDHQRPEFVYSWPVEILEEMLRAGTIYEEGLFSSQSLSWKIK